MAIVYTIIGRHDEAITTIDELLSVPSFTTVAWVRMDPIFEPLRDNPDFQAVLAKHDRAL